MKKYIAAVSIALTFLIVESQTVRAESPEQLNDRAERQRPSDEVNRVVRYIKKHRDTHDVAIILDKKNAIIYVFNQGKFVAASYFLHGARSVDDFPGGSMEASYYARIPISQKQVTPAGAFNLVKTPNDPDYGRSLTFAQYKDYRLAIHRVYRGSPSQHRVERLYSRTSSDNLISMGCVNVTDEFFDQILDRLTITKNSYVYIIPYHTEQMSKYLPMVD
jgi:hypothetical protein